MEFLLKSIFSTDLYIKWFNPKEDDTNGVNVYLHVKDKKLDSTFTLKFRRDVTRYDVVTFLKELHELQINTDKTDDITDDMKTIIDNADTNDNSIENNETIIHECSAFFEFYSKDEVMVALDKLKIFTKNKYIFFGESNISITHEQDEDNKLWYTHFYKKQNFKKSDESECIACICNKLSYVFDD
jgi:hypothetical protein